VWRGLVISLAMIGTAEARDWEDLKGGAWLHYELSGLHARDSGPGFDDVILAGARLHGFIGGEHVGFHAGFDFALGSTVRRAGFAYEVTLLPVGIATRFGKTQMMGIAIGVGAIGAVGTYDDAATFPLEAFAEFNLGDRVRLLARGRYSLLAGAPEHEADATIGVRVGRRYHDFDVPSGNGYFVAVTGRELASEQYVGVVIGYSIDLGSPQR
jgi:hypothetical protein